MKAAQHLAGDLRAIFAVGLPLIVNNISSIGVTVADTVMASRLGPDQLAAVAIGSGVWIALFLLGLGVIMALGPTVAQHYGAGRTREIGHDTRQGIWLGIAVSLLVIVLMRSTEPVLTWIGIEASVVVLSQGYLDALSFGVPGAYAYHTVKQMSEGVGRTVPIMVVMGIALPINIFFNYTFMFGAFGAPALGAVGCGLGNAISFWIMFTMLALYTARAPSYRAFEIWRSIEAPDIPAIRRLVLLGAPIGLSLFLQSGLFTTVALLMGAIGTTAVAAHQVVLNYSGLVFMVPLGLGMALTVVVGQAVGRLDMAGARRVGLTGMVLCGMVSIVAGVTTWVFATPLAGLYGADRDVTELAIVLFKVAAALQIGDGIQVAAAFALRGLKDTKVPMLLNAANYWGIGFALAYLLGITLGHGAIGIWIGLATALCAAAVTLIARFVWLTRKLLRDSEPATVSLLEPDHLVR